MKILTTIGWPALLSLFVVSMGYGAEFADTSFKTKGGDLITKGMSKAEVTARFRRPDEKDVITHGPHCQVKVEVWNYYLKNMIVIITFTGNEASNIKVVRLR